MAHHLQRALTFSNVCSFLALLVALGTGGAYAVGTVDSHDILNKTIRSVDIKNGQVKSADLGPDAVDGSKVVDGAVANADLAGGAVTGAKVSDNSIGVADLVGVEAPGTVSLSGIPNGRCNQVTFGVLGAQVGQAAVVTAEAPLQNGIVLYAQSVAAPDQVNVDACNFSGTTMTAISGFPVRVFTFG